MKQTTNLLLVGLICTTTIVVGGGTLALLKASTSTSQASFTDSSISASTVKLSNSPTMMRMALTQTSSKYQYTMFYDHADYPTGQNPYDYKTNYFPSGEIPGGWAPGDEVKRTWSIQNSGSGSKITEITAQLGSLTDQQGNSVSTGSQAYNDFLENMNVSVYPSPTASTPVYTGTFAQLVSGPQYLNTVICLSKSTTTTLSFVATMNLGAGDDLQGVKGDLDFSMGAEQTKNDCFDPPFSNKDYSMSLGSATPIKFEDYDSSGNLITTVPSDVSLVITGQKVGGGTLRITYSLSNGGLTVNGGHYQAQVYGDPSLFVQELDSTPKYTATVYYGNQLLCQKSFSTYPSNRSNS